MQFNYAMCKVKALMPTTCAQHNDRMRVNRIKKDYLSNDVDIRI